MGNLITGRPLLHSIFPKSVTRATRNGGLVTDSIATTNYAWTTRSDRRVLSDTIKKLNKMPLQPIGDIGQVLGGSSPYAHERRPPLLQRDHYSCLRRHDAKHCQGHGRARVRSSSSWTKRYKN